MKRIATCVMLVALSLMLLTFSAWAKPTAAALECAPGPDEQMVKAGALNTEGLARMGRGELEAALASFVEAGTIAPDFLNVFWNQAVVLARLERHEEALVLLESLLPRREKWGEAYVLMGDCQFALNRHEDALVAYQRALNANQSLAAALVGMARIYEIQGNLTLATDTLENGVRRFPADREINWVLGNHYLKARNPLALAAFYRIQATEPNLPGLADRIALAWFYLGQDAPATMMAGIALQEDPDAPNGNWIMASAYAANKDWSRARPFAERLVAANPANPEVLLIALETAVMIPDRDWAEKLTDALLESAQEDPEILVRAGLVLARDKQLRHEAVFGKALTLCAARGNSEREKQIRRLMADL